MPTIPSVIVRPSEPFKGAVNVARGLQRWRLALAQAGRAAGGAGFGGVDIIAIGTSVLKGYNLTDPPYDCLTHQVKLRLQSQFNPLGVPGGYGLVRVDSDPGFTQGSTPFTLFGATAMIGDGRGSSTAMTMRYWFNGAAADAVVKRLGVTSIEPLYVPTTTAQSFQWDIGTSNAFVTPGTGNVAKNVINSTGTQSWAKHHGSIPTDGTSGLAPTLNPSTGYSYQLSPSTGQVYLNGVIAYNGDEACGVRVHNLAVNGSTLTAYFWNDANAKQVVSNFCTGGFGATQGKLILCDYILNEALNDPTLAGLATFKANLAASVQYVTSLGSKPAWLHLIPLPPTGVTTEVYRAYANAIVEVATANPDVMAVINMAEVVDYGLPAAYNPSLGWLQADNLHPNGRGAAALAGMILAALSN